MYAFLFLFFFLSSIEYTHISISIFDNLKYKKAALYLGVRSSFIFLLSQSKTVVCSLL